MRMILLTLTLGLGIYIYKSAKLPHLQCTTQGSATYRAQVGWLCDLTKFVWKAKSKDNYIFKSTIEHKCATYSAQHKVQQHIALRLADCMISPGLSEKQTQKTIAFSSPLLNTNVPPTVHNTRLSNISRSGWLTVWSRQVCLKSKIKRQLHFQVHDWTQMCHLQCTTQGSATYRAQVGWLYDLTQVCLKSKLKRQLHFQVHCWTQMCHLQCTTQGSATYRAQVGWLCDLTRFVWKAKSKDNYIFKSTVEHKCATYSAQHKVQQHIALRLADCMISPGLSEKQNQKTIAFSSPLLNTNVPPTVHNTRLSNISRSGWLTVWSHQVCLKSKIKRQSHFQVLGLKNIPRSCAETAAGSVYSSC